MKAEHYTYYEICIIDKKISQNYLSDLLDIAEEDIDAKKLLGLYYLTIGEIGQAEKFLTEIASIGDGDAVRLLAKFYNFLGETEKAIENYNKAINLKNYAAAHELAALYLSKKIMLPRKAFDCYKIAANNGFAPAQLDLGLIYSAGWPQIALCRDERIAENLYKKVLDNKKSDVLQHLLAATYLGFLYSDIRWYRMNIDQSVEWHRRAINIALPQKFGVRDKFYMLTSGEINELKAGVKLNCDTIVKIYIKSGLDNDSDLMQNLLILPTTLDQHILYTPVYDRKERFI